MIINIIWCLLLLSYLLFTTILKLQKYINDTLSLWNICGRTEWERARTCVISYCRSCFCSIMSATWDCLDIWKGVWQFAFLLLLLYIDVHYIIYSSYFHPFDFIYYYYYNTTWNCSAQTSYYLFFYIASPYQLGALKLIFLTHVFEALLALSVEIKYVPRVQ